MNTSIRGLIYGSVAFTTAYAYNRLGEKGKLPHRFGWVTPSSNTAKILGLAGVIIGMTKFSLVGKANAFGLTTVLLTLYAIENSRKEIEIARKIDDTFLSKNSKASF